MTNKTITPRWYQVEAVAAVWDFIRQNDGNPCVELPTGAGKSIVIARLMLDTLAWGGRVVLLAHRKELLEQTAEKIEALEPSIDVGVFSAGLKRRDTKHDVLAAGIQSVRDRADQLGRRDVIIVDEAHLIPTDGDGMFRRFIADSKVINPNVRIVGLTATPYRLRTGLVCGDDHILNQICYSVGVKTLISQGYLCPLTSKATAAKCGVDGVSIRGGEFVAGELQTRLVGDAALVSATCDEIWNRAADRKAILIFTSGVQHGEMVRDELLKKTNSVEFLDGETDADKRAKILKAFRKGRLRFLVNVDVLTTGFDSPNVDCVAMLRPTLSPGLYYQMVGRGFRLHDEKTNCLVLDFGQNVERHGPVDKIEIATKPATKGGTPPTKTCEKCHEILPAGLSVCPACGFEFPPPEIRHEPTPTDAAVVSDDKPRTAYVEKAWYHVHEKRGQPDAPKTLRVDYTTGFAKSVSE